MHTLHLWVVRLILMHLDYLKKVGESNVIGIAITNMSFGDIGINYS